MFLAAAIPLNRHFFKDCIVDFLALLILRQIFGLKLPVSSSCHCQLIYHLISVQNLDLDRCWALAILIISIIPNLLTRDFNSFRSVGVGNGELINLSFILSNSIFLKCVNNLLTISIFRQVFRFKLPSISSCYFKCINNSASIHYLNCNRCWAFAVLIVCIIPDFLTRNFNLLWSMRVGNLLTFYFRTVTLFFQSGYCCIILFDRVDNLLSLIKLRQIGEACFPSVSSCLIISRQGQCLTCDSNWLFTIY